MAGVIKMLTEKKKASNAKWDKANSEQIILYLWKSRSDPTKEEIKAAAERDGLSVNAWIVEAIKDKL